MTLTIVGVVTLLILVLSATFAYFSAPVSNDKKPTNVTATTEAIGSIALSNPTGDLHLNLTVSDMAQDKLGSYWATNDSAKNYDEEEVQREIAVAELSGGAETLKYECTTTISVELSDTMASKLQSEDAYIQFGGLLTEKVDLTNVSSEGYEVTFKLDGTNVKRQAVTAAVAIANRNADQSYIAGTSLGIKFSNSDLSCQVVEAGKTLSETIMALAEVEDSGVYHETASGTKAGTYSVIPANESSWSSMTLGEGVEITSESEGTYQVPISCEDKYDDNGEIVGEACTPESSTSTFKPLNSGYYKVATSENTSTNIIRINVDNNMQYEWNPFLGETVGSKDLGYLTPENTIEIVYSMNGPDGETGNLSFEISYAPSETVNLDAGYRYEGAEVNNYVTFNDETWRIIGVEEGSTIGLTSGEYYTKIIKNDFLSPFSFERGANIVGSYYTYYYETDNDGENYYGVSFVNNGLKEAKALIVNAKWYIGGALSVPYETYVSEYIGTWTRSYVGGMSASDYGYAALQSRCANVNLREYSNCESWLFNNEEEILISHSKITELGNVEDTYEYDTIANRPVVYLKSNVVITNDGTGAEGNKFEIGL